MQQCMSCQLVVRYQCRTYLAVNCVLSFLLILTLFLSYSLIPSLQKPNYFIPKPYCSCSYLHYQCPTHRAVTFVLSLLLTLTPSCSHLLPLTPSYCLLLPLTFLYSNLITFYTSFTVFVLTYYVSFGRYSHFSCIN